MRVGVCFDIDGVLLRGSKVLPGARESLKRLVHQNIPFLFITNGGGHLESHRAKILSEKMQLEIHSGQIILSHTPMRTLADVFSRKRVMILGCRNEMEVARQYGFERTVSPQQFCAQHPDLYPFRNVALVGCDLYKDEEIEGILVMHDPVDWHLELQVCVDILLGRDPLRNQTHQGSQVVPIYNSNEDFVFAGAYEHPRFAQGAFLETLQHLFKRTTAGKELQVGRFGKPHKVTFDHAAHLLAKNSNSAVFDTIFMIGDNLDADIKGTRLCGKPWQSILVKSGIYKEGGEADLADTICENVGEAVNYIIANKLDKKA